MAAVITLPTFICITSLLLLLSVNCLTGWRADISGLDLFRSKRPQSINGNRVERADQADDKDDEQDGGKEDGKKGDNSTEKNWK
ncbi:hypothetical protein COOONC_11654 [Cooperia oncophora]